MQIILEQEEMEKAIVEYIGHRWMAGGGMNATVEMKAARGEHGFTATVTLTEVSMEEFFKSIEFEDGGDEDQGQESLVPEPDPEPAEADNSNDTKKTENPLGIEETVKKARGRPKGSTNKPKVEEQEETPETTEVVEEPEPEDVDADIPAEHEQVEVPVEEARVKEEKPAEKPRSLFSNLKTPKNDD